MRKILFTFMIIISFNIYCLQKSGIKEYDNLDLTSGETFAYFNEDFEIVDDLETAFLYGKKYGGEDNIYTLVYFYTQTDTPFAFYKYSNVEDTFKKIKGTFVLYAADGSLGLISKAKPDFSGRTAYTYENGKIISVTNIENDTLNSKEEKFLNEKITNSTEYKDEKKNGKVIHYNKDGSIAVEEFYENDKFIKSKNVNYKLQKTGIEEYDNIDFSKGEIIAYYNENGNIVSKDSDNIIQYRKSFGRKPDNGAFLVADYYINTNNVQAIIETETPYYFDCFNMGKYSFAFYDNGNMMSSFITKEDGETTEIKTYDYFGNLDSIGIYKNRKPINIKYF